MIVNVYVYVYMYICIYVYMYICIYVYMYICIYVYMYICIYVYMCICVYVYMYMYMYMYTNDRYLSVYPYLSIHPSILAPIHRSIDPLIHPSIHLSICICYFYLILSSEKGQGLDQQGLSPIEFKYMAHELEKNQKEIFQAKTRILKH